MGSSTTSRFSTCRTPSTTCRSSTSTATTTTSWRRRTRCSKLWAGAALRSGPPFTRRTCALCLCRCRATGAAARPTQTPHGKSTRQSSARTSVPAMTSMTAAEETVAGHSSTTLIAPARRRSASSVGASAVPRATSSVCTRAFPHSSISSRRLLQRRATVCRSAPWSRLPHRRCHLRSRCPSAAASAAAAKHRAPLLRANPVPVRSPLLQTLPSEWMNPSACSFVVLVFYAPAPYCNMWHRKQRHGAACGFSPCPFRIHSQ
mmetsp:Transcript_13242/g.37360  ORF Transcript_13242/g.37360 Transcript_13242/m.37360 type:complete len:261 (-) Transcript_13242:446-1228(-)